MKRGSGENNGLTTPLVTVAPVASALKTCARSYRSDRSGIYLSRKSYHYVPEYKYFLYTNIQSNISLYLGAEW